MIGHGPCVCGKGPWPPVLPVPARPGALSLARLVPIFPLVTFFQILLVLIGGMSLLADMLSWRFTVDLVTDAGRIILGRLVLLTMLAFAVYVSLAYVALWTAGSLGLSVFVLALAAIPFIRRRMARPPARGDVAPAGIPITDPDPGAPSDWWGMAIILSGASVMCLVVFMLVAAVVG